MIKLKETPEERKARFARYRAKARAKGRVSLEKEREYAARFRKNEKEKYTPEELYLRHREENLWLNYGVTLELYDALLNLQGGVCSGCGRPPTTGRALDVDHEHVKNYKKMPPEKKRAFVRMLLCHRCNRALGLLGNEPILLGKVLIRLADRLDLYVYLRNILLNLGPEDGLRRAIAAVTYLERYENGK